MDCRAFLLASVGTGLLLALANTAWAQHARPDHGMIHDRERGSSLVYRCMPAAGGTIQCIMFQTVTFKRWSEERVAAKVAKERAEFNAEKLKRPDFLCQGYKDDLDVLEGRKELTSDSEMASLTADEKVRMKEFYSAWLAFCAAPTADNWVRTIEMDHSRQMRTCTVRQQMYGQAFRWVKGPTEERSAWVALPDAGNAQKEAGKMRAPTPVDLSTIRVLSSSEIQRQNRRRGATSRDGRRPIPRERCRVGCPVAWWTPRNTLLPATRARFRCSVTLSSTVSCDARATKVVSQI